MNMLARSGIKWSIELPDRDRQEILDWCKENFGEPNIMNGRWFALEYTIQFSNQKDRNWYRMRWGL